MSRAAIARHDLAEWREHMEQRDRLVAEAAAAGLSVAEIARLAGLHRNTVQHILRGAQ